MLRPPTLHVDLRDLVRVVHVLRIGQSLRAHQISVHVIGSGP